MAACLGPINIVTKDPDTDEMVVVGTMLPNPNYDPELTSKSGWGGKHDLWTRAEEPLSQEEARRRGAEIDKQWG
jgi:hypothetical protein